MNINFFAQSIEEQHDLHSVVILDAFNHGTSVLILATHEVVFLHCTTEKYTYIFEVNSELKYTNKTLLDLGFDCLENFDNEEIKDIFYSIKNGSSLETLLKKV